MFRSCGTQEEKKLVPCLCGRGGVNRNDLPVCPWKTIVRKRFLIVNTTPDPSKPLRNQKALVTGANSGIGEACALALGAAGADVVVNYVFRPEEAERVVKNIRHNGTRAIAFQADVSQENQVQAMFAEMLKEFGTVDILVNNA